MEILFQDPIVFTSLIIGSLIILRWIIEMKHLT
jgi:hypothetical protein